MKNENREERSYASEAKCSAAAVTPGSDERLDRFRKSLVPLSSVVPESILDDDVEGNKGEEGFDDEETAIDCDEQSEDSNDDDENEENSNRKGDVDDGNPLL